MIDYRPVRFGSLDCLVADGGESPSAAAIICHGYGAPGHDLAGLAGEWLSLMGERAKDFRFVFPAAPNDLSDLGMPDGRAWWPINMSQLMSLVDANQFDQLHNAEPPGIDDAMELFCDTVEAVAADLPADAPMAWGGFSQGAMLTMHSALCGRLPPPQLLLQFSGTLVCQSRWCEAKDRLAKTRVFQSHGTIDPVLPFASAQTLADEVGAPHDHWEFQSFLGPHTISPDAVMRTAQLLAEIVSPREA